ncbi:MAG: MobF family relaxase, partial [Acidimicrobiales bacterium]
MARMTRIMRSSLEYYARSELDEPLSGELWGRRYDGTSVRLEDPDEGVRVLMEELSEASGVRRRIAVLDLTFAAPKSVSVRWGLGAASDATQIETAHRESVARALWYLRTTDLGKLDHQSNPHGVLGLAYVAFTHRLSRDGDPHLHDHVVVMNAARFEELGMRTLDLARVASVLPMLEVVYRAELQRSLRRELGIELVGRQLGSLQIMGQSEALTTAFSSRREAIMSAS